MVLITDELLRKRGWIMDNNLNYDEKFYRLPKRLFTEEQFQNMTGAAKLLYMILLDRRCLSELNGDALKRIEELENENAELKKELEYYKNRKMSGRQKHNAKWMAIYNDFVVGYESGMTMVEIAKRNNVSERTIYRYKAYYDKMKEAEDNE